MPRVSDPDRIWCYQVTCMFNHNAVPFEGGGGAGRCLRSAIELDIEGKCKEYKRYEPNKVPEYVQQAAAELATPTGGAPTGGKGGRPQKIAAPDPNQKTIF